MMHESADEMKEARPPRSGFRERVSALVARVAPLVRPWLEQTALNLKVWIPALLSKAMKSSQVKYRAREHRNGLTWKLIMPSQCWQCGTTEGLKRRDVNLSVRAFDGPLPIAIGTFGIGALFWILTILTFWWMAFSIGCLLMVLGAGILLLKSWTERVKLTFWTCAGHAEELTPPAVVSYDEELFVFLPTEELAERARAEVVAARRREGKYTSEAPLERPANDGRATAEALPVLEPAEPSTLPTRLPGTRTELPPLKLAGEEDQPPT
jgi:hypothetical protein